MESFDQLPPQSPEQIKFQYGEATVANEKHPERNEDSLMSLPEKSSFAVFDGVGGVHGGSVASQTARDNLRKGLESLPANPSWDQRIERLKDLFDRVNISVIDKGYDDPNLLGMESTVSFVQFVERKLIVVNVGDSRVYVFSKDGKLEQVTTDDGKSDRITQLRFNEVRQSSELAYFEKQAWEDRRMISNALGTAECEPRIQVLDLKDGDTILITSDGIHDNLTTTEIAEILSGSGDNTSKAQGLVLAAQKRSKEGSFRSKKDDMTALVVSPSK